MKGNTENRFSTLNNLKVNRITTANIEKWIRQKQDDGMYILTLQKVIVALNQIL